MNANQTKEQLYKLQKERHELIVKFNEDMIQHLKERGIENNTPINLKFLSHHFPMWFSNIYFDGSIIILYYHIATKNGISKSERTTIISDTDEIIKVEDK